MSMNRRNFLGGVAAAVPAAACGGLPARASSSRDIFRLDLRDLAFSLENQTLSAEACVSELLGRIRHASDLNAFITLYADEALRRARAVDKARRRGARLPPLAGVPFVAKDNIDLAGQITTAGTPALRDSRPNSTAPVLQALLSSGMILLGKTNLHELALGVTSSNVAYGFVKNPYDTRYVPGGSAGGTAAAIAARLAPCGLGTDTSGSLRIPASFCGIASLRPSVGNGGAHRRYPVGGIAPINPLVDTAGPMARSIKDVAMLDAVVTGGWTPRPAFLKGIRLGVPRAGFWSNLDAGVQSACEAALRELRRSGVTLVDVNFPDDVLALDQKSGGPLALHAILRALPAYLNQIGSTITYDQLVAQVASPDAKAALLAAPSVPQAAYLSALNVYRPQLQTIYAGYFRTNNLDGAIFPTVPVPPPLIDPTFSNKIAINGVPQPAGETGTCVRNTDPGAVAGIPGICIPVGLTSGGLPVGVEIDGPLGSDLRLLAVGMAVEQVFGRLPAPTI